MRRMSMVVFVLLIGAQAWAQAPTPIAGEYLEARSGHVYTCGCQYSGEQVTMGREAILAWSFRAGEFRGTPLAGVRVAAVVVGDAHLGLEETPRKSVVYLDGASTEPQRQAVLDLLRERFANVLGTVVTVHTAPIAFQNGGDQWAVGVGETLSVVGRKARLPEDAHPGSSAWYGPFISVSDAALSTTLNYKFWGPDFQRKWSEQLSGITGYIGRFTVNP